MQTAKRYYQFRMSKLEAANLIKNRLDWCINIKRTVNLKCRSDFIAERKKEKKKEIAKKEIE